MLRGGTGFRFHPEPSRGLEWDMWDATVGTNNQVHLDSVHMGTSMMCRLQQDTLEEDYQLP